MRFIWKCSQSLVLIALILTVAIGVPTVNALSGPPRSVFVSWPEAMPVPTPTVTAKRQSDGRWIIEIAAEGFVFSDICKTVSGPQAIGHAHVYEGDVKIAAAYAPRQDIGTFAPGKHRISVVLRAQDHRVLVSSTGLISAEIVLNEPMKKSPMRSEIAG
jgi:hypothetical protein